MYLLDSNIFINFYDRYYKQHTFPSFWTNLKPLINENVIIPKIVMNENYQDVWFRDWVESNYDNELLNHVDYAVEWGEILEHIKSSIYYKNAALDSDKGWANSVIADPWIIAIAKKESLTIVTDEKRNPNLSSRNPSKSAKIPDVCDSLGIRCITMNDFFVAVGLII